MAEQPVRVVLANDDHIIIEGLRAMLAPYDDEVEVVATAEGDPEIVVAPDTEDVRGRDAHRRLRTRAAGGIDAAVKVLAEDPPFAVAVFTDADDLRLMLQALRMGVRGYLLKSSQPADLVDMLERLRDGETVIDRRLATEATLLAARTHRPRRLARRPPRPHPARGRAAHPAGPGHCAPGWRPRRWGCRRDGPHPHAQPLPQARAWATGRRRWPSPGGRAWSADGRSPIVIFSIRWGRAGARGGHDPRGLRVAVVRHGPTPALDRRGMPSA